MNAGLAMRLLRPASPGHGLALLGEGLDDIIQHTTRTLLPEQRLLRYVRARHYFPPATPRQAQLADLRFAIGTQYQQAWRNGLFPRLYLISRRFTADRVLARIGPPRRQQA